MSAQPLPLPVRPRAPSVLLAEDHPQMRALMAHTLRRRGFEVVEVADGPALVEVLRARLLADADAGLPDLIITDVRMPGLSGLEVLARLRRSDASTPVVLVTAFGDEALHAQAEQLGARVLDKPFDLEVLGALAEELLAA